MAKIVGFGYRFCKKQDIIFALWDDGKRTIFERVSNPHINVDFQAEQYAKARDVAFVGEIPLTNRQPNTACTRQWVVCPTGNNNAT